MNLRHVAIAAALAAFLAAPALAAPIQYQASDHINTVPVGGSSAAINTAAAATVQLVALQTGQAIYVTSFDFVAGGTTNVTLEYGTGSLCGTGTTALTGAYPLTAQSGVAKGAGVAPVLFVPAGNALCVVNSAAVQLSGSISYAQQ